MADANFEVQSFVHQQLETKEQLNHYLSQAESLAQVALGADFLTYPTFTVHEYLCALSDIIESARRVNDRSLSHLLRQGNLHLMKAML